VRLACVTQHAVLEQRAWAKTWPGIGGACYYLTTALQQLSVPVDFVGSLRDSHVLLAPLKAFVYDRVFRKRYYTWAEPSVLRHYSRQISSMLDRSRADIVFCPTNARPIAYLDCKQPIVLWTDAPFSALIDYYEYLSNLSRHTNAALLRMETAALQRCARVLYSSEWAAEAAIRDYALEPSKVTVVPWGANLDVVPSASEAQFMIDSRTPQPYRLLFVGMWWKRKGGDIALAVAQQLNDRGLPTELTVVGCESTGAEPLPSFVRILGFLDKSTDDGREAMQRAFSQSHFLILPSRADCTPLVIAEANAFGVPCLTSDVGGMATLVRDGRNGRKFSKQARVAEYCDYIMSVMRNYESYRRLAWSAFQEYESRLNWTVAARITRDILEDVAMRTNAGSGIAQA
jgi:glycosyltransferase involved in cell wall biosynthesis